MHCCCTYIHTHQLWVMYQCRQLLRCLPASTNCVPSQIPWLFRSGNNQCVPPTHIHLVFYLTYAVGANLYGVSTLADTAILPPILYFLVWGGFKLSLSYIQLDRVEYSDTSCMNIDDLSSKSFWGVSNSATSPEIRTMRLVICKDFYFEFQNWMNKWQRSQLRKSSYGQERKHGQFVKELVPSLRTSTRSLSITVGIR